MTMVVTERELSRQNHQSRKTIKWRRTSKRGSRYCNTVTGTVRCKNENLLKTATVLAENLNGLKTMPVRLLLDDGSQKSHIRNHVRTELNLQTIKTQNVYLNTFGNEKYNKQKLDVVKLKLKGRFNGYSTEVEITAMCVPSTCSP